MKILLVGNGAREHIIAQKLKDSPQSIELFCFASSNNPGIINLAQGYKVGDFSNENIISYAKENNVDFVFVGPESPLEKGLVDDLEKVNIKSVGPYMELAQLETSKSFARQLFKEYNIPVNPEFKIFESMDGVEEWLLYLEENFVIKPDGLTGGKGVQVSGDHFQTMNEGMALISKLIENGTRVIIEEKLIGQEFSLMSFSDGEHLVHMPCAQDNKRALAGDTGPNTGGMGSYSFSDGSMPFISDKELKDGQEINLKVMKALKEKTGKPYRGILYGNFIATKKGLKIIEYNARLGDPEAMNVLSVFKSDFVEVCLGIIEGNLNEKKVEFENKATVCKYAVPQGYPEDPIKDETINVDSIDTSKVDIYYAAVDKREDGIYLTGSRAVAIVAKHEDIYEAERLAEEEINNIIGPVIHREDIGKKKLIEKRIEMMNKLKE